MAVMYLYQQSINLFFRWSYNAAPPFAAKNFLVEERNNLSVEKLKQVCEECSISTKQRSAVSFNYWNSMYFYCTK